MNIIKGDLIDLALKGKFEIIIHGCNCFNSMGKGIAKSIKNIFPEAYEADMKTIRGNKKKLGTYSMVKIKRINVEFYVINAYTQYHYRGKKPVNYSAIRKVFKKIKQDFKGRTIGYPKIGAGLAGGDWRIISSIINEELKGENHTLVLYNKN